jgi:hypothetical protein
MSTHFEVTVQAGHIRRGFPFRVTGEAMPAEPSVGLMRSYLDDLDITTLGGGSVGFLKLSKDEVEDIEIEVWEQFRKNQ